MFALSGRREFLKQSAGLAVGASLFSKLNWASGAETGKPLVACRDAMMATIGEKDCWKAMNTLGLDGIEAGVRDDLALAGLFHPEKKYTIATEEGVSQLAADMKASGGRITAFCMSNKYEAQPDREIELATAVAKAAKTLGVPAVRIDVVPHKVPPDQFLELAVATLKKTIEATEGTGVKFGIENHGRVTNNPEFLRPLLERVGSPRLGITLDTANFYWFGHPLSRLYEIFESFAKYAVHTHCKSINYPAEERNKQRPIGWEYGKYCCPIDKGDIDFARLIGILRKAGYQGDYCIENESLKKAKPEECAQILGREVQHLRKLLG